MLTDFCGARLSYLPACLVLPAVCVASVAIFLFFILIATIFWHKSIGKK
jgi:hypothetical protein